MYKTITIEKSMLPIIAVIIFYNLNLLFFESFLFPFFKFTKVFAFN